MDEQTQQPEPKISIVVGVLGTIVCLIADAISFIPIAADVEEAPMIVVLFLSVVFKLGGASIGVQVVVDIIKAIPGMQELPLWTPAWLFIWWLENSNSKIAEVGQMALTVAAVAEGDVEEVEEIEEETAEAAESQEVESMAQSEQAAASAEGVGAESGAEEGGQGQADRDENEEPDSRNKKRDGKDEMAQGDEISPEEQARGKDFDTPNPSFSQEDDEQEDGEEE